MRSVGLRAYLCANVSAGYGDFFVCVCNWQYANWNSFITIRNSEQITQTLAHLHPPTHPFTHIFTHTHTHSPSKERLFCNRRSVNWNSFIAISETDHKLAHIPPSHEKREHLVTTTPHENKRNNTAPNPKARDDDGHYSEGDLSRMHCHPTQPNRHEKAVSLTSKHMSGMRMSPLGVTSGTLSNLQNTSARKVKDEIKVPIALSAFRDKH